MITTAVGNYPKVPSLSGGPNLRRAIGQADEGRISREELARVEEEATVDAIKEQVEAGLDLVTDGQVRWDDGQTYLAQKIAGFAINGLIRYFDSNTYYRQPIVEGKLAWRGPITVRDYQFAREHSAKPVKAALTGPFTLAKLSRNAHYQRFEDLVLDLARALNQEALALAAAGTPLVQFDEPMVLKAKGEFPLFREAMGVLREGVATKTALYTYFGDLQGLYPKFLELPFDLFGLDMVAGPQNYALLAQGFPADKELALGIVDARNTKMETVEEIAAAIERVRSVVPPDRLYVNPNCGLEFLPRRNAYNKLVRLVEGARRAQEVLA